jgi:hypothetical protein
MFLKISARFRKRIIAVWSPPHFIDMRIIPAIILPIAQRANIISATFWKRRIAATWAGEIGAQFGKSFDKRLQSFFINIEPLLAFAG